MRGKTKKTPPESLPIIEREGELKLLGLNFHENSSNWDTHFHIWSLSTSDFETQMAKGSELFSLITRLYTSTFTMLSTFSRLGMISVKMWETPLCWHTECSLPVAVRVSKTRMPKVPQTKSFIPPDLEDFKSENVGKFPFLTFFHTYLCW